MSGRPLAARSVGHGEPHDLTVTSAAFGGSAVRIWGSTGVQVGHGNVMSLAASGAGFGPGCEALAAVRAGGAPGSARGQASAFAVIAGGRNGEEPSDSRWADGERVAAGVRWAPPPFSPPRRRRSSDGRTAKPAADLQGAPVSLPARPEPEVIRAENGRSASRPSPVKAAVATRGSEGRSTVNRFRGGSGRRGGHQTASGDATSASAPIPIPTPRRREGEPGTETAPPTSVPPEREDKSAVPLLVPGGPPPPVAPIRRECELPAEEDSDGSVGCPNRQKPEDLEGLGSGDATTVAGEEELDLATEEGFTLLIDDEEDLVDGSGEEDGAPVGTSTPRGEPEESTTPSMEGRPRSPSCSSLESSGSVVVSVPSDLASVPSDPVSAPSEPVSGYSGTPLTLLGEYLYGPGIRQGRFGGRGAVQSGYLGPERRCRCHGAPSRGRYCALRLGGSTGDEQLEEGLGSLWLDHLERVERCAADVLRVGSVPLYRALIGGAARLLEEDPTLDLRLARYYLRGLRGYDGTGPSAYYGRCTMLRPEVRQFFVRHGSALDAMVASLASRGESALGRGLLTTSLLVDRIGSRIVPSGRDESPMAIFCRAAATLATDAELLCPGGMSVASGGPSDAVGFFESLFGALTSFRVVLPSRTLAYLGWRGENPLFPSCSYRAPPGAVSGTGPDATVLAAGPEITFNGALRDVLDLLSNGVSVSVAAADLTGDVCAALRILGLHCRALRFTTRFPVRVCVYVDLWSVAALKLFAFILDESSEFEELHFAFNVPRVFWNRYLDDQCERSWTCLFDPECDGLSRLSPEDFQTVYERRERLPAAGLTVSVWWMLSSLDACVARGRTSVVFPQNGRSMYRGRPVGSSRAADDGLTNEVAGSVSAVSDAGLPGVAGPDLACWGDPMGLTDSPGVTPYLPVYVNLENCVLPVDDPRARGGSLSGWGLELDAEDDEWLGADAVGPRRSRDGSRELGSGRVFSFNLLRESVRDAVMIGNLLLDSCLRDNPYGTGDAVALLRPLQIAPIGFHAALNRLGLSMEDPEVPALNRRIFETMHLTALLASSELAASGAGTFPRFQRTRYAEGCLYADLWEDFGASTLPPGAWDRVRDSIRRHGLRNASFICVDDGEEAALLAETTPGAWPRRANLRYERSPLLTAASREEALSAGLATLRDLKLSPGGPIPDDAVLLRLAPPRPVFLPAINRLFDTAGRGRVTAVLGRRRRGAAFGAGTSFEALAGEGDVAFETAVNISPETVLRLAVDRRCFVDQPQCVPIYVSSERSAAQLSSFLRRAHALDLAVGVYRCHLLPSCPR